MKLIEFNSVGKEYAKGFFALENLSFEVEDSNFVSIVGPFGCGKTTILNLLSGVTKNYFGTITIGGKNPEKAKEDHRIGYVFQKPTLLPWRNVIKNITLPQELNGIKNQDRAYDLLRLVGLGELAFKMPCDLSGGMKQLVSIARSLILEPDVLLLDEPFSSIDEINRTKIHLKLLEIHKKTKGTTILVTHSLAEAVFLSDQIIVLTPRPAKVKKVIDVNLSHRGEEIIFSEEFLEYKKAVNAELIND
ncbi:MAG: ATP-binding cassette domain-containing protein [bacterium]|nr:ATP-binding cassette domain-containing protein [bacterium]